MLLGVYYGYTRFNYSSLKLIVAFSILGNVTFAGDCCICFVFWSIFWVRNPMWLSTFGCVLNALGYSAPRHYMMWLNYFYMGVWLGVSLCFQFSCYLRNIGLNLHFAFLRFLFLSTSHSQSLLNSAAVLALSYLSRNMLESVSYLLIYTFLSYASQALLSDTVC